MVLVEVQGLGVGRPKRKVISWESTRTKKDRGGGGCETTLLSSFFSYHSNITMSPEVCLFTTCSGPIKDRSNSLIFSQSEAIFPTILWINRSKCSSSYLQQRRFRLKLIQALNQLLTSRRKLPPGCWITKKNCIDLINKSSLFQVRPTENSFCPFQWHASRHNSWQPEKVGWLQHPSWLNNFSHH